MGIIILCVVCLALRVVIVACTASKPKQIAATQSRQQAINQREQFLIEWRQAKAQAAAEAARIAAAERARMAQERAERQAQEQARKEAERAQKAAEKERKAAFAREQAEADLEHFEVIRAGYMDLMDVLEEELQAETTTDKRRLTIRRQLLTLEEKLYRLDQRRAKAYFMKGAC